MNNRELASLILLTFVFLLGMTKKDVRDSLARVLESLSDWKIWLPLLLYAGWMAMTVLAFWKVSLWNRSLLGETIIWSIISGIPIFFGVLSVKHEDRPFHKQIRSIFQLSAVFLFASNLYVMPIWAELIAQLFLAIFAMISSMTKNKKEDQSLHTLSNRMISILAISLISFSLWKLLSQTASLDWRQISLSFFATLWLPLSTIVFLFPLSVIAAYENAFTRFSAHQDAKQPSFLDKLVLITSVRLQLHILRDFKIYWGRRIINADTFSNKRKAALEFVADSRRRVLEVVEARNQLVDMAGVIGLDQYGQQLDKREFTESKNALHWVHTCQIGHFRKRDGSYEPNLLTILGNFASHGLPGDHGIQLRLSEDGQSWYAYRRVATGRFFAIGASGPPPDIWYFDGPDLPSEFPGQSSDWDHWAPGKNSQNWG